MSPEDSAQPRTPLRRLGSSRKLAAYNNIRVQLGEQVRWLEARAEAQAGVLGELHEYCRRRAELEADYSRALDKLARSSAQRHHDSRNKRAEWSSLGTHSCWQQMVGGTRLLARDHAALAELYGARLAGRLHRAADHVLRLHKKCKEIVCARQEEVCGALAEVCAAGRVRAAAAADWRAAAGKLRAAAEARARLPASDAPRRKLKHHDKELDKRRARYQAARVRALRARADYVLCLEAANATLHNYYVDDLADLIDCTEVGVEALVRRAVSSQAGAELTRAAALQAAAQALRACAVSLDARADQQRFLETHQAAFLLPRRLAYQGAPPEQEDAEMQELVGADGGAGAEEELAVELAARLATLEGHARALRAECREHCKTLDAAEAELVAQMEGSSEEWEVSGQEAVPPPPSPQAGELRRDQEDFYVTKLREYVSGAARLARLEGKAAALRARGLRSSLPAPASPRPRRARAAAPARGQFAAPLDQQLATPGRKLPLVLTSCVRVISEYGLRHQGIFRVSGSQSEMQALRAAFERGEDPLADVRDASEVHTVAGLLKLYLRELRPPLLPPACHRRLQQLAGVEDAEEWAAGVRGVVGGLAAGAARVLGYLCAFLAAVAEHSPANMMDAGNLAVCVGPALLPAGGEVAAQNLLNLLVKRLILHHHRVFPPQDLYLPREEDDVAECCGPAVTELVPPDLSDEECDETAEERARSPDLDEQDGAFSGRWSPATLAMDALEEPGLLEELEQEEELGLHEELEWQEGLELQEGLGLQLQEKEPDEVQATDEVGEEAGVAVEDAPAQAEEASNNSCRLSCLADSTPDLVLNLPAAPPPAPDSPPDTADTFLAHCDTLKKKPAATAATTECVVVAPVGDAGAEVPAEEGRVSVQAAGPPLQSAKPALPPRPVPPPRPAL